MLTSFFRLGKDLYKYYTICDIITASEMMIMSKQLIWDWNGTLFNDVDLCVESINYLLASEQLPTLADKEAYRRVFRFPIITYYQSVGFDFNQYSFDELAIKYMDYYQPRSLTCSLYENALECLKYYHKQGYVQILLSASKEAYLMNQLKQFSIQHMFHRILALDNIHAYSKAELAVNYMKENDITPEDLVFIGDSVHDYEVAQNVGASCILIANGHEHKERLKKTDAIVIDSIGELPKIIV